MRNFIVGILLALSLPSCVKELDISDVDQNNTQVYAFAFFNPDSVGKVSIGRIQGITQPFSWVDTAKVLVENTVSGEVQSFASVGNGDYQSSKFTFETSDSLLLSFSLGLTEYHVMERVPEDISIEKVETYPFIANFVGRTTAFSIRFKDSAAAKNHYRIWINEAFWEYELDEDGEVSDSTLVSQIMPISGTELPFIRNEYNVYTNKELLFTDETFNGLNTSLVVYRNAPNDQTIRRLYFDVYLENLSPSLFHYYNDRNAHLWQQNSITQLPTAVEGNWGNAYGVFGIYRAKRFRVAL